MACMNTRNFLVDPGSSEEHPLVKLSISQALPLVGFEWEADRVQEAREGCESAAAALEGVLGFIYTGSELGPTAAGGSTRGMLLADWSWRVLLKAEGYVTEGVEGFERGLPLVEGSQGGQEGVSLLDLRGEYERARALDLDRARRLAVLGVMLLDFQDFSLSPSLSTEAVASAARQDMATLVKAETMQFLVLVCRGTTCIEALDKVGV